jgi:hypothetical protein
MQKWFCISRSVFNSFRMSEEGKRRPGATALQSLRRIVRAFQNCGRPVLDCSIGLLECGKNDVALFHRAPFF